MTAPIIDQPGGYPCLSVDDVARLLGVHAETVRRRARSGAWRAYRIAGQWRFCRDDVDAIAFGEPNLPVPRLERPLRGRPASMRPGAPGSVSQLDQIEREMRGAG